VLKGKLSVLSVPDGADIEVDGSFVGNTPSELSVTAPSSSQAGPVDVKLITPDGAQSYNPLDFSYGPSLLFVNGDTSTPSGGTSSYITGLGLPQDPTQIQVTVGGRTANVVTAVAAPFYGVYWPFAYPYPAVELKITLPPGSGDEDLVVTTSTGFSTLPKAIHYVQSVTDYASSDVFQSILLDRPRNQRYLSAGDHIDVFSLTTSQFLVSERRAVAQYIAADALHVARHTEPRSGRRSHRTQSSREARQVHEDSEAESPGASNDPR
jgi:hypothetical protein